MHAGVHSSKSPENASVLWRIAATILSIYTQTPALARRRIGTLQHPREVELVVVLGRDEVYGAAVCHGQV